MVQRPTVSLGDRQCRFLTDALFGWNGHSAQVAEAVEWLDSDRLIVLSRDGTLRELSLVDGGIRTYRLVDPATGSWPHANRPLATPRLIRLPDRGFALQRNDVWLEFDLPRPEETTADDLGAPIPLPYRLVRGVGDFEAVTRQVRRLIEAIRPGRVDIASKALVHVAAGLDGLASEVRFRLGSIVVGGHWCPTLRHRGRSIDEATFCAILVEDGSDAAVRALDALLTTFLDATEGRADSIWHPDDLTPTMGPVAHALIALCDPVPSSVMRFVSRRDMEHDMWTGPAFSHLGLSEVRLLKPDLTALQIRLAVQDICTGNAKPNIFALHRLALARAALRADPARASDLAEMIAAEVEAQAPAFSWATDLGVAGLLRSIADGLDAAHPAEAALASELRRRAGG